MDRKPVDLSSLQINPAQVHRNLPVPALIEVALAQGEGRLTESGALATLTGKYTGRSPGDKFIVDEPEVHDKIAWGPVNQPFAPQAFDRLLDRVTAYLSGKELFVFDGFAGAEPKYRLPIRVVNEYAWHNLFVHQLFLRPTAAELAEHDPQFTVISAPGFKADPAVDGTRSEVFIIVSFKRRIVLIGGTEYAGEMKKSIFTVLNCLLPEQGVFPMHCSANAGVAGDTALFFGLSGTGKTTLSADPDRFLIGDDEHGWSDEGIFNFEGGCYAKCIGLSCEQEPQIWNAIRFGAVLENTVIDAATRAIDFASAAYTENTRAAYPVDFIPGAVVPGVGRHPDVVIFLTADATGVLPPIARLTPEQAMYHFLSGYTSKLAGTERGVTEPQATFSACFGAPFLPLSPVVYAKMLGEKIRQHNAQVYLVNTGWTGGPHGQGSRMKLAYTRTMVRAAISGELEQCAFRPDPIFGVLVPEACPGVPAAVLQPRQTWQDAAAYDRQARDLAQRFAENFTRFADVPAQIAAAGPTVLGSAR